jgi:hypothetical protein
MISNDKWPRGGISHLQTKSSWDMIGHMARNPQSIPGLVNVYSLRTGTWPIEIVDLPIEHGDFP